jgi:hypothetical protein
MDVDILDEAKRLVTGKRAKSYGSIEKNFNIDIATLWETWLTARHGENMKVSSLDGFDVAMMMVMVKVARLAQNPSHIDSIVDIAGYAHILGVLRPEVEHEENPKEEV